MIKRYEATTLEEACSLAVKDLNISIDKLDYDIVQYPSKGILGLFSKKAIIVVALNEKEDSNADIKSEEKNSKDDSINLEAEVEAVAKESIKVEDELDEKKDEDTTLKSSSSKSIIKEEKEIFDSFSGKKSVENEIVKKYESIDAKELENKIKKLIELSCFNIDTVEVDIEDNTAYVFIDGDDAALLIGKEGYRYNALSYLLFNWINSKYGFYLKLEIAQFLASQQDMIEHQLQPVVEHIEKEGWGRTKELDGILVQIALEYLRDRFPNKYVAIKRSKSGDRYIIINEFNKR